MSTTYPYDESCVAVIGMAARLPGAGDIREFWENLVAGRQSMEPIPDEALAQGLHAQTRLEPDYVAMRSTLSDFDLFDADFFGFSPRDASIMDPQHRLVLEYAWRAFENAGHEPVDKGGMRTGVYASSDMSGYMTGYLYHHILSGSVDVTEAVIGCDKDYLATRIAYKCNLHGPAMAVQSSCSSSLLSVHTACQALLAGECDRALVTACTVLLPENLGWIYLPGGMRSPDGRCRPYDAGANGTIFASGVIAVLLRRLEDAVRERDNVIAVVRATAATNDGCDKVGYTAPSINGQAAAITAALSLAGAAPEDVSFVEGHGTATPLGDPIELAALKQAYAGSFAPDQRILLGSLKGNIGHLDAAAGLASFAKTALCLQHRIVPGTANFTTPNPAFGDPAPFRFSAEAERLETGGSLLGGVSAFGIGGTNVHAVLQDPPPRSERDMTPVRVPLLVSAHNEAAYDAALDALAARLETDAGIRPVDAAWTLAQGRRHQPYRAFVAASTTAEAAEALRNPALAPTVAVEGADGLAFLFPGQGNLHAGMARAFYAEEPAFRSLLADLGSICLDEGGPDLVNLLERCWRREPAALEALRETATAQPLLFALEAALAQLLMNRGIRPDCLIGHSLGEYTAACTAGVLSFEDGMRLVTRRGALMQTAPGGRMLVVSLHPARVRDVLGAAFAGVEISLVNSAANCVLTGPQEALEACEKVVAEHGQRTTWLKTSHAFHSASMEDIMDAYGELVSRFTLRAPELPVVSNVTGTWAGREMASPDYWVRHLRSPVQFARGMAALREKAALGVEAGPGSVLRSLASQQEGERLRVVSGLDPLGATRPDAPFQPRGLADIAGELWLQGAQVDWSAWFEPCEPWRCPLPETSFTPRRYWMSASGPSAPESREGADKYARSCRTTYEPPAGEVETVLAGLWENLLFVDRVGARDDFLELGGNSIQVMQMVRQAAGLGLSFTSRDVFDSGTIRELAKRAVKTARAREARPGPVPVPAYLAPRLEGRESPLHRMAVFDCPADFDKGSAGALARALAERHDALRMSWSGSELRLAGIAEHDWAAANVDSLVGRVSLDADASHDDLAAAGRLLAGQLRPEACKAWSLALTGGSAPRLLLAVHAAIADERAMRLLRQDILAWLDHGQPCDSPAASWALWLEDLAALHEAESAADAALPLFAPGCAADEEGDVLHLDAEALADLRAAARVCRAEPVELACAAAGLALRRALPEAAPVLHLVDDGSALVMPAADPAAALGSIALDRVIAATEGQHAARAVPAAKTAVRAARACGAVPWLTAPGYEPPFLELAWSETPAAGFTIDPAEQPRRAALICRVEAGEDGLRVHLAWPAGERARSRAFLDAMGGALRETIAAALSDPAAAAWVPADFPESELTQADLDAILSQLAGDRQ